MVKILAGEKGEGKTKRMIDMANAAGKEAKGNIVFVMTTTATCTICL